MKLLFSRDQRQDEHGKVIFGLTVRGELTHEERAAISKYGFGSWVLFQTPEPEEIIEKKGFLASMLSKQKDFWNEPLPVSKLESGVRFQYHTIFEVLEVEQEIKSNAAHFKTMISAASGFGGEEVIEL